MRIHLFDESFQTEFAPVVFLLAVAFVLVIPQGAAGDDQQQTREEEPPLSLTFVDATPETSGPIYRKLRRIIENSDDIAFHNPDRFLKGARNFEIDREVLGSIRKRSSHRELIRRAMRADRLESIVVYKRVEDTLHLVVIGPTGTELRHFRERAPNGPLGDEQAIVYLEQIFKVLVPDIRAFRKQRSELEEERRLSEQQRAEMSDDPREEAIEKHRRSHGNLRRHLTVEASPLLGRRSLTIETEGGFRLAHSTPFLGVQGRVAGVFGLIAADTAALGARGYVGYAPFSTRFSQQGATYAGTYFRAGATVRYLAGLSPSVVLFGEAGGEAVDIGIESNSEYVGSSYVAGRAGLGVQYRISSAVRAELAANALPTVRTTTHGNAFGAENFSVGALGDARFGFFGLDPLLFTAFYTFELYMPRHPNPPAHDGSASGTDMVHLGGLAVGYRF